MLAFTNTVHTKESAVALAEWHQAQDNYIKGTYGEVSLKNNSFKGCSVGCMAAGKHNEYPELMADKLCYFLAGNN
jgi:hypothetical protein